MDDEAFEALAQAATNAEGLYVAIGMSNTAHLTPVERAIQTAQYEDARTRMYELQGRLRDEAKRRARSIAYASAAIG